MKNLQNVCPFLAFLARKLSFPLTGLLVTLLPVSASAVHAPLTSDTYISAGAPTKNYGSKKTLNLVIGDASTFLIFDLSTLPPGTTGQDVAVATLRLWTTKVTGFAAFDVLRVTGAWNEATMTAGTAPATGAAVASGVTVSAANQFVSVDVTAAVKEWLDSVLPNNGLALQPTGTLNVRFDSKENKATGHEPMLEITLSSVTNFGGSLGGDVTGTQTATNVGKLNGSPLGSLVGATSSQALTFSGSNWSPSSVVNSLTAGSGLSGSGSTGNVTVSVPNGGVTNGMLANSSVTVTAGSGLSGGGAVALGGTTTLSNAGVLSVGASAPLASSGGQSPNVSLSGTVALANGGTGASAAAGARSNLGAAASGANSDITSLSGITGNIDLPASTSTAGNLLKTGIRFLHDFGSDNTFLGRNAGNFTLTGPNNTGVGRSALAASTTGDANTALGVLALGANDTGFSNTAVGVVALAANTSGGRNTAVGRYALQTNTTGVDNTAVGLSALDANTTASRNTAVGEAASQVNTTGSDNSAFGQSALILNTASSNTAVGQNSLRFNTSGANNIAVGKNAGINLTTGNNNIDIGSAGAAAETNTIRIGSVGTQTATYIAGINGATSNGGVAVFVDSSGQLGTTTSSARFKQGIEDMGDSSSALMKLRPVRFQYTPEIDPSGLEQYGLVAEEVAKSAPDLVVYDEDGQPQTVRYHFVNAMLLNEVQKQSRQIAAQKQQIDGQLQQANEQAEQLAVLRARLAQVEAVLGAQGHPAPVEIGYRRAAGF